MSRGSWYGMGPHTVGSRVSSRAVIPQIHGAQIFLTFVVQTRDAEFFIRFQMQHITDALRLIDCTQQMLSLP